ncbi:nuclear transport factor 2 family protein [Aestuariirhabdus sp. LZHN29]|uniref:nuclear transport factor 2 family protein n=1 Tax=Aestuariirhabdus sp. LZHN29 TaxID=3417462 RepID=UPI003CF03E6A
MQSSALIECFKAYYRDFSAQPLTQLDQIYSPQTGFRDPIHQLSGREELKRYFASTSQGLDHCRFEFRHQIVNESNAFFSWVMHYAHPRIKGGKALKLDGATQIRFTDQVLYHEDFYDMGAMLYQHLPVIGWAVRSINQRLMHEAVEQ